MEPELLAGVVSKEGDVYALGVCLYELATGRLPAALPGLRPASAWRRGLPCALDALVEDCLVADPAQRLGSPAEFGRRLASLLAPSAAPAAAAAPLPVAIK